MNLMRNAAMKIVSLAGNPRGLKGNTGRLLSHVLEGA